MLIVSQSIHSNSPRIRSIFFFLFICQMWIPSLFYIAKTVLKINFTVTKQSFENKIKLIDFLLIVFSANWILKTTSLDHTHRHTHTKTRPTPSDLHSWFKLTSSNTIETPMLRMILFNSSLSCVILPLERLVRVRV